MAQNAYMIPQLVVHISRSRVKNKFPSSKVASSFKELHHSHKTHPNISFTGAFNDQGYKPLPVFTPAGTAT